MQVFAEWRVYIDLAGPDIWSPSWERFMRLDGMNLLFREDPDKPLYLARAHVSGQRRYKNSSRVRKGEVVTQGLLDYRAGENPTLNQDYAWAQDYIDAAQDEIENRLA